MLLLCAVGLGVAGCTVGPDYARPDVAAPATFRGDESGTLDTGARSFGDLEWASVFPDPEMQALIRTALAQNYDVRVAAVRVQQAQSLLSIARSQQFPTAEGSASAPFNASTGSDRPATLADHRVEPQGGLGVAWEVDFWGRFRRGTESARAELLASEEARFVVMAGLVAQIGEAYLALRAQDRSLEIARRTVESRMKSLELVQARLEGGVVGLLDLRQAEVLLYSATKTIATLEREIEQTENLISVLLGQDPGPIKRRHPVDALIASPALPPGLPSELLTRRPDIRSAEQQLVAANAQIGVAKALLYPRITLSGFAGAGGLEIDGSSFGPFGLFQVLPTITLPVFNMGRLQANVEYNEAVAEEAGLRYRQTLQQAFGEVSNALIGIRKRHQFLREQESLVESLDDASQVAKMRYAGGVSSYLEVLDTERQLFDAELDLVQAKRDVAVSIIQLYKALGGGWQGETPAVAAPAGKNAGAVAATAP